MGRELQRAQDHLLLLVKTAPERMASFLLEMAARIQSSDEVELAMSRQDIADYLGLTIETVSRTLTQLESQSAIALPTCKRIVLRNRAALKRLSLSFVAAIGSAAFSSWQQVIEKRNVAIVNGGLAVQGLRTIRFDTARMQRTIAERNGCMAITYTMSTINNNPNIARMSMKFGESSATNNAGTKVTAAHSLSTIQSSITSLLEE